MDQSTHPDTTELPLWKGSRPQMLSIGETPSNTFGEKPPAMHRWLHPTSRRTEVTPGRCMASPQGGEPVPHIARGRVRFAVGKGLVPISQINILPCLSRVPNQ